MTKEEFIALGVAEDIAAKLAEASTKELEGYVSKTDFDLLTAQKNNLDKQAQEHAKQLEDLKKSVGDSDKLKQQIADLQAANKKAMDDHAKELLSIRTENAIDAGLRDAKAKNAKAVRALLDMEALEYDDEKGVLKGLSKQLKSLQEAEDSRFLFEQAPEPNNGKPDSGINSNEGNDPSGQAPGNNGGGVSFGEQMAAMFNAEHAPAAEGE